MARPKGPLGHEDQHGVLAGKDPHHPIPGEDGAAGQGGFELALPQKAAAQIGIGLTCGHVFLQRPAR